MNAYLIIVDNENFGILQMTEASYNFAYWINHSRMWHKYLPAGWKSFSIFDMVKGLPVCGSVKSVECKST